MVNYFIETSHKPVCQTQKQTFVRGTDEHPRGRRESSSVLICINRMALPSTRSIRTYSRSDASLHLRCLYLCTKIWNRCDEPKDPSMERNFYAKRLFPCWVMASQEPFKDDVGGVALLDAMNTAVARAHFKEVRFTNQEIG